MREKRLLQKGNSGRTRLYAVPQFKTRNKLGDSGTSEGKIGKQSWGVLFSSSVGSYKVKRKERVCSS
ncbi:hypothetical protein ABGV42_05380 [Paenibacillus pabuli]